MDEEVYVLTVGVPTPEKHQQLRIAAGMNGKSLEAISRGLPNTLFGVTIRRHGELVGMGRIIGDGGMFFQVVDIAVEPHHQGRGLGKRIVRTLVEHAHQIAPPGAYVSLLADGDAHHLYAKFGFRPTAPLSIGMSFSIR